MKIKPPKAFYWQRLPHSRNVGSVFFVTFRLHGSLPKKQLEEMKHQYEVALRELEKIEESSVKNSKILNLRKRLFGQFDHLLDSGDAGPMYLKQPVIAKIVTEQLHRFDGVFYDLIAYSIMGNHVHILIDTSIQEAAGTTVNLDQIMKRIKGASARYANKELGLTGAFWERESFDMYMRNNDMLYRVIRYILNNPVKAHLVRLPSAYEWNYLNEKYGEMDEFVTYS